MGMASAPLAGSDPSGLSGSPEGKRWDVHRGRDGRLHELRLHELLLRRRWQHYVLAGAAH